MAKINSIRYIGKKTVYNMEVFDHHNFLTPLGTVLHNCRYFAISRKMAAEAQKKADELDGLYEEDKKEDYEDFLLGGNASADYMTY